ncbi:MAG: glycosyltransferase family 4 protein [Heyndrickxia sp.]
MLRKKVLFCATMDYHFKAFHVPILKWFKEQGWEVHVAASGELNLPYVDKKFNLSFERSPFKAKNLLTYFQLKEIMERNDYNIIHCHTPMGGVLGRLAARKIRKTGTKVLYTAHGFHFCKGAPILNWLMYYPIEKILANITDCLITINQEDFHLARNHRFNAKLIKHVHGVGVSTDRFTAVKEFNKQVLKAEHGYHNNAFLMFYAAEFNKNKNHQLLIRTIALIKDKIPRAKLILAGEGPLLEKCKDLALQLGVDHIVEFLGFTKKVDLYLKMSDIALASSLREGLPVNIMEAMACGLPVVASTNRGHSELVVNGENGYIISPKDAESFGLFIVKLYHSKKLRQEMGHKSVQMMKQYNEEKVVSQLSEIYTDYMVEAIHESENKYSSAYF